MNESRVKLNENGSDLIFEVWLKYIFLEEMGFVSLVFIRAITTKTETILSILLMKMNSNNMNV